ncbi:hypothetical protein HYV79_03070 [Candidatus Woesearchaeota archaeon]|nr:hypothetical protein [Candidatus Woesearchaeota archaeon]
MIDQKKIALRHIKELLEEAEKNTEFAKRYVHLARNISKRTKTPIPSGLKRRFCKKCSTFFIIGENCRVRTTNGKVSYTCLECKNVQRFPYIKEQKQKRASLARAYSAKSEHKQIKQ